MTESNEHSASGEVDMPEEVDQTVDTGTSSYGELLDDIMQYASVEACAQAEAMSTSMKNYGEVHGNSVLLDIAVDNRFLAGVREASLPKLVDVIKRIVIDKEPKDDKMALLINADLNNCCGRELAKAYVTYCEENDESNLPEARRLLSLFDFDAAQGCFMIKRHIEGKYNTVSGTLPNGLDNTTPPEVLELFYDDEAESNEE